MAVQDCVYDIGQQSIVKGQLQEILQGLDQERNL